ADRDAPDADGLVRAHVRVSEGGAGVAVGELVAGDAVVRERDRGRGGAIVDLVHARGGDGPDARVDAAAGVGDGADGVVAAAVAVVDRVAGGDGQRLAAAGVPGVVSLAQPRYRVTALQAAHCGQGAGAGGSVVSLGVGLGGDGQRGR